MCGRHVTRNTEQGGDEQDNPSQDLYTHKNSEQLGPTGCRGGVIVVSDRDRVNPKQPIGHWGQLVGRIELSSCDVAEGE